VRSTVAVPGAGRVLSGLRTGHPPPPARAPRRRRRCCSRGL